MDPRLLTNSGREVFTGCELVVKGALEADGGVHLLTGYPGSPVAGIFDALQNIGPHLHERGILARIANNEALSVAMVNGAQMAGCRAITAFKSVGLHVASDALALGVLAGTRGDSGGLIVCGDDSWSDSTQVPADSRFLAEHVRMPMLEPSCPQEVKDWVNLAFKIGQAGQIYMGYTLTVPTADGGGSVECRPNQYPELNVNNRKALSYERDIEPMLEQTVLLPPRTGEREQAIEARHQAVKAAARRLGVNTILHRPQRDELVPMGFVASGMAFAYLMQALADMGLAGRIPVLKLGLTYPIDEQIVLEFAQSCSQLIVVEERRPFAERQIAQIIGRYNQGPRAGNRRVEVYGKQFPYDLRGLPETRGLSPSILVEHLVPLVRRHPTLPVELTNGHLAEELARIEATASVQMDLPVRSPTFCPGCPHRDSSSVLLEIRRDLMDAEYMLAHHKRKAVDLVCHGDTGCYTMLMFEPNKPLMHNYSGMGLGGGTGSGSDPFIDNKQIVFMGDGTFFHSGQVAISHSIASGQDITYIILDNKITAMTGHQPNPGDCVDLMGQSAPAQDIERVVQGLVPKSLAKDVRVVRVDPADRDRYRKLLEQTILADGVKVVIADKECGITFHRRANRQLKAQEREHGFLRRQSFMNVATDVCENCLECTTQTGCPGLTIEGTEYGPKVQTDLSSCVNDGACYRIGACPSFEDVTVVRTQKRRDVFAELPVADLPEPPRPMHAGQDLWRCYIAGVGGMGIGLATAVLVRAGHEMGYDVQFLDKKGLAIRNGGVSSQLVYSRGRASADAATTSRNTIQTTAVIPYGKAHLLLGLDILEAARSLDPRLPHRIASPDRTATLVNTSKTHTVATLMGKEDFQVSDLIDLLRSRSRPDAFHASDIAALSQRVFGNRMQVNIILLGLALQKGYLPLKLDAMQRAIEAIMPRDKVVGLQALTLGRLLAVRPEVLRAPKARRRAEHTPRSVLARKSASLLRQLPGRRGRRSVRDFRQYLRGVLAVCDTAGLPLTQQADLAVRAADCLLWGGLAYVRRYCERIVEVMLKDAREYDFAITAAAIWNLARVMLIKDEVYVSALLTSPAKYEADRERFGIDPAAGDRLEYRHHNRPEFEILGHSFRFDWTSRDWQLRLMARMRILRSMLPAWHRRERAFRDWYDDLLARLEWNGPRDYQRWLAILRTVDGVTGYREVRYPKMDSARSAVELLLATDPELLELPGIPPQAQPEERTISLPVLVLN